MFNLLLSSLGTLLSFFEKETCCSSRVLLKSECVSCSVMSDSLQWMDCSPPGFSIHGILQARILESVHIAFSRGSSRPRDWTQFSHIAGGFFTVWATREAQFIPIYGQIIFHCIDMSHFVYPFTSWKAFGSFLPFTYYE